MRNPHQRTILLTVLFAVALILGACTRTASTQPVPTTGPAGPKGAEGTSAPGGAEATMDAVRAGILTQTAVAALGQGGGEPATGAPPATPAVATPVPPATATTPLVATPVPPAATAAPAIPAEYTVQPGEWIYSIARKFNLDPQAIINANPGINPNLVYAGQVIKLPQGAATTPEAPAQPTTLAHPGEYTVKQGDWIYSIARAFGVMPEAIIAANPSLTPPYTIYAGQVLKIP
ncbi:MAG: LysM peptidoglycan-binding domain-containing protein [Chloroflexi bacterium]|nr:LysM peptidoglycan-binding domain-containing protein [Chloroflexota bacterium]